jgi:hypothetical protein
MPSSDRDWNRGEHPPACTCVDCVNKRLGIVTRKVKNKYHKNHYQNNSQKSNYSINPSTQKETSGCARFLSCSILLFVILVIVGLVGGGIYGITKYNGDIGHGIAYVYKWVADGVVSIKDNVVDWYSSINTNITETPTSKTSVIASISTTTPPPTTKKSGIDSKTGVYKNYYLGLVNTPGGVITGEDCYGEFIVLINNKDAHNPTYSELLSFLKSDTTDTFPYLFSVSSLGFYYGKAEDQIDLEKIKNIIDGITKPDNPKICADFTERLHNNAEMAGLRCGYVSLDTPNHALNVFETTDKGLIFIDDTGTMLYGPDNCDKSVDLKEGSEYIPKSLFHESGWSDTWDSLGIVRGIFVTWDGKWRN